MSGRPGPRILIIRLSAIGDVIVTTPVSRVLREAIPDAHLAWVVEPRARDILTGNPYLDEVIVWDRPKGVLPPAALWRMHRVLKPKRFDWAIDFQGLLRTGLLARLSGARHIVGNTDAKESAELLYTIRVPRRTGDLSSRQRCLDLLRPLGVESADRRMVLPIGDEDREAGAAVLASEGLEPGAGYACLVPATTWAQKHWFDERWAEVAGSLYTEQALVPVLMGGPADRAGAEGIRRQAGQVCVVAAGRTSLKTAAAILEGARVTVAVDTALMHASVAVGTPTVGVCGASWWPGFQDYENFTLLREPMTCSPCLRHPTCGGRYDCMRALSPKQVLEAARRIVNAGALGREGAVQLRTKGSPAVQLPEIA